MKSRGAGSDKLVSTCLNRLEAGDVGQFLRRLERYFRQVADPQYRAFCLSLRTADGLGVRAPLLRRVSAAVVRLGLSEPLLRRAVAALWKKSGSENRALALLLIQDHWKRRQMALASASVLRRFAEGVETWDLADSLGGAAGLLIAGGAASVEEILPWTRARSPWVRRIAAVAGWSLFQHDRSRLEDALRLIEPLLSDDDRDVRMGVAFSLRNIASRTDAASLRPRLELWTADRQTAPAVRKALRALAGRTEST